MSIFKFKAFNIIQEKSAMKVGTDGVLLGAWANVPKAKNILDIGAGTGLISLMQAQQNKSAIITALEIEKNAFEECTHNFENSEWQKRLTAIHTSLQNFESPTLFDCIISNPPFFNHSYKNETIARSTARQNDSLPFELLLQKTSLLLSEKGNAFFIIPFDVEKHFLDLAKKNKLFPNKICYVKGTPKSKVKRILLSLSKVNSTLEKSELCIEISRHEYTEDYKKLTQAFYLNM